MLIVPEGKNATERKYFDHFRLQQNCPYAIIIRKAGNRTSPQGLLRIAETAWEELELQEENGDCAYIVLDLDCKAEKLETINSLQEHAKTPIRFIMSNPCFEVWYLMHYQSSVGTCQTSGQILRQLRKHVPNYQKKSDVAENLIPKTPKALDNWRKVKQQNKKWPSAQCIMTDVPEIVKKLI